MAARRMLNLFKSGVEATVRHWSKEKLTRFSLMEEWGSVGYNVTRFVADKFVEENGLQGCIDVEVVENRFYFRGLDDALYGFELKNHMLKVNVDSPQNSQEEVVEEGERDDEIECSVIDDEIKAKYGEPVTPEETELEVVIKKIAKLERKPNKTSKQKQKLKELRDRRNKLEREARNK